MVHPMGLLAGAAVVAVAARREVARWRRSAATPPAPWRAEPPTVSVLVPTLNEEGYVEEACRSLAEQSHLTRHPHRVERILVDSGSTDGTVDAARAWVDRVVHAPKGKLNALTAGVAASRGAVVAEADADGRFPEHWLAHLVRPFEDARVAGVFGPVVYDDSPVVMPLATASLPVNFLLGKFPAGARAYRRIAYERAGGFRTDVDQDALGPLWFEEEFAFPRRLATGGRVCFVPEALCYKSARRLDPVFVRDRRARRFRRELSKGERFGLRQHVRSVHPTPLTGEA